MANVSVARDVHVFQPQISNTGRFCEWSHPGSHQYLQKARVDAGVLDMDVDIFLRELSHGVLSDFGHEKNYF